MTTRRVGSIAVACGMAVLLFVLVAVWLAVGGNEPRLARAPIDAGAPAANSSAFADPAAATALPSAERSALAGDVAGANGEPSAEPPLPPVGRVTLLVLDAESGALLENEVHARFVSDTRVADAGGGKLELALTPGKWQARIAARGYEPIELDPFTVKSGELTELGTVRVARGSAAIDGIVRARHLAADAPVNVELFGEGRAPCAACRHGEPDGPVAKDGKEGSGAAGPYCGYRDESSLRSVRGDRRFHFGDLAAGVYWLRACEPDSTLVALVKVEVGRGGHAWRELEVTAPTVARIELRSPRGGSFAGDWASVHLEKPAPISFEIVRSGRTIATLSHEPAADDVRATAGRPPLPHDADEPVLKELLEPGSGTSPASPSLAAAAGDGEHDAKNDAVRTALSTLVFRLNTARATRGEASTPQWLVNVASTDRGDRKREESDALEGVASEPELPGDASLEKLQPDVWELRKLPRELLTIVVHAGGFDSVEQPLDLRFGEVVLFATLLPNDAGRAQLDQLALGTPASCVACHSQMNSARANVSFVSGTFTISIGNLLQGGTEGVTFDLSPSVPAVGGDSNGSASTGGDRQ